MCCIRLGSMCCKHQGRIRHEFGAYIWVTFTFFFKLRKFTSSFLWYGQASFSQLNRIRDWSPTNKPEYLLPVCLWGSISLLFLYINSNLNILSLWVSQTRLLGTINHGCSSHWKREDLGTNHLSYTWNNSLVIWTYTCVYMH